MKVFSGWGRVRVDCWLVAIFTVLLVTANSFATKRTVDADGTADYSSLDAVLTAIAGGGDWDTIEFIGNNQHTYSWSTYCSVARGTILFRGISSNPALFPVINLTESNGAFNFFNLNHVNFENLSLTSTMGFSLGQNRKHKFTRCIIKNCTSARNPSYALFLEGNADSTSTIFENCLFTGNTCANVLNINYWGGNPTLKVINCTFDANTSIVDEDPSGSFSNFSFVNCIFSNNTTTFRGNNLRGKTTYSLTSEALTGYGAACSTAVNPGYSKATRTAPADWRPSTTSKARDLGTATGAPSVDISDTVRIQDATGKRDAGCWDIKDTVKPPVISVHPVNVVAYTGDTATFSVTATGTELTYAWKRNGTAIAGATSAIYKLGITALSDSGLFTCTVANSAGSVTSQSALLQVKPANPDIQSRTSDTTVTEGASLTLSVSAIGKEPLVFSWKTAGAATELSDANTLILTNLAPTAGVTYRCVVSNSAGKDSADVRVVVANGAAARFTAEPGADISIRVGQDYTLQVTATGGEPLHYTWYKNGTTSGDSIGSGSAYAITNAEAGDSGKFYCIVGNSFGSDTAGPVVLRVITANIYNILTLKGEFVEPTKVRVDIGNFRNLPSTSPSSPWVDTIGIWYNNVTFPAAPLSLANDSCIKFPLQQLLAATGDTFTTVITVPLAETCTPPLYLVIAPHWKNPDSIPPDIASAQRATVTMCASDTLENLLVLDAAYPSVTDSIIVTISNITSINPDSLLYLLLDYRKGTGAYTANPVITILKGDIPGGVAGVTRTIRNALFTGVEDSVWVRVRWRSSMGNFSSSVTKKIIVGNSRPDNTATLSADSSTIESVYLHWSFPQPPKIDSIRIVWSRQPPAEAVDSSSAGTSVTLTPDQKSTILTGLTADTRYYIGLQVLDSSVWSLITPDAQDTISTKSLFPDKIPNTIKLIGAQFDSSKNLFTITWDVDTTGIGPITTLETGIVWAVGAPPGNNVVPGGTFGIIDSSLKVTGNSRTIAPGADLKFSSTYYFALLLRRKHDGWSGATDSSVGQVATPPPSHQVISYFSGHDTVTAFNGQVQIWKVGSGVVSVTDTVKSYIPESLEGFIVASLGVDFAGDVRSDPVGFGLTYDPAKLAGQPRSAVRMYQYNKERKVWNVLAGCTVDSTRNVVEFIGRLNDYPLPFVLMIDTVQPMVSLLSATDGAVPPGVTYKDTLVIEDNVANSSVGVYFWNSFESGSKPVSTLYSDRKTDTIIISVPGDSVISDWGVKVKTVISDGRFVSVYDVSRSVLRSTSDPVIIAGDRWTPVITTAHLNDTSIEGALSDLSEKEPWFYDSTRFLIYRWYDTVPQPAVPVVAFDTSGKWLEYSRSQSPLFSMVPGKVIWIKTRSTSDIKSLGSGTTVSLKEDFTATLRAHQWTDIALPFKFNITLGDVITATGFHDSIKNSIYIYSWVIPDSNSQTYTTTKYISTIPGLNSLSGVMNCTSGEDGLGTYTIFNWAADDITLRIPPLPKQFSSFKTGPVGKRAAEPRPDVDGWSVTVRAKTGKGTLAPVYCGFTPGTGSSSYPVSPSFGKQRLAVLDPADGTDHGHFVRHERTAGGCTYQLQFINNDPGTTAFSFDVAAATPLPENYLVGVYDPTVKKINYSPRNASLTVDENARVSRWLLVGDSSFIVSWVGSITKSLSLLRVFPNPCRGEIQVHYMLPDADIRHLEVSIFDQLGRRVWRRSVASTALRPGMNSLRLNPKSDAVLGAGAYIIRITAFKDGGSVYGSRQQRLLYVP